MMFVLKNASATLLKNATYGILKRATEALNAA
jgi:hypothetical protein